jgi:hypothetical protein
MGAGLFGLVFLVGIAIGIVAIVRKVTGRQGVDSDGADLVAYLLLAIAVGTAAFSLAELLEAAFPGDAFISDTEFQVASALAGLVVAGPLAWILWRRQAERRTQHPASAGWVVYLTAIEAVFMIAFAVTAFLVVDSIVGDGTSPSLVNALVFLGVLIFHDLAVRKSPPTTDGAELPRVVGSAVGLVMTSIGLGGVLNWAFDSIYGSFVATSGDPDVGMWLAFFIVGAPIWVYRWWRPWPGALGTPRKVWLVLSSAIGLAVALGMGVALVVMVATFFLTESESAGLHFSAVPGVLATGVVAILVWVHHRRSLGNERTEPIRSYEYALAALGLGISTGAATVLTSLAFAPADFVDEPGEVIVAVVVILVAALSVWGWFWDRAQKAPREIEVVAAPRRFYLVGLAVIAGLTAAGALIATLVVLFQTLIGGDQVDDFAVQASLFVFSGLVTWHLLRNNAADREMIGSPDVVTPFDVTVVCSHPGTLATLFPKEARLRIIYRGDDGGVITEGMAASIVEGVASTSSIVWVEGEAFRIAPGR